MAFKSIHVYDRQFAQSSVSSLGSFAVGALNQCRISQLSRCTTKVVQITSSLITDRHKSSVLIVLLTISYSVHRYNATLNYLYH